MGKNTKKKSEIKQKDRSLTHPPITEMILSAVKDLKDPSGSSLQAIKKYIAVTYLLESKKQARFINNTIKAAVANGILIQTKGSSGRFKLPPVIKKISEENKPKTLKTKTGEKAKTTKSKNDTKKSLKKKTTSKPKTVDANKSAISKKSAKTQSLKFKNLKAKKSSVQKTASKK